MGLRNATEHDLAEELERVKRHIDQAVFDLSEARGQLSSRTPRRNGKVSESEMANLCISLELALADSVVWAQRLAERIKQS